MAIQKTVDGDILKLASGSIMSECCCDERLPGCGCQNPGIASWTVSFSGYIGFPCCQVTTGPVTLTLNPPGQTGCFWSGSFSGTCWASVTLQYDTSTHYWTLRILEYIDRYYFTSTIPDLSVDCSGPTVFTNQRSSACPGEPSTATITPNY